MDATTLKIAMSGFFHDMGKFAGKEILGMSASEIDKKGADFLPSKKGYYSHQHALFTAEFIENYHQFLPAELNANKWGEGDGFIRLAAAHHNPSSAMEWIIAEADRLSSGMDRKDYDEADSEGVSIKDFEKTRLVPIFEAIDYENPKGSLKRENFKNAYPLEPLSNLGIFPKSENQVVHTDDKKAKQEYQKLFDGFVDELKSLAHRDTIELWFEHFESLVMRYTSSIPSARVKNTIPDVSLYDHLRTTSALASALYLYHSEKDTLKPDAIKNENDKKFLLISADFSGIQNFIFNGFGDTRKYRSKLLRGRSFYVSLMTELAADMLCREIGLPFSSVILNAGGKITLLAPNTDRAKTAYQSVKSEIEKWLVSRTYGETSIIFSDVEATPGDFKYGKFHVLQARIQEKQALQKFQRFDLDTFGGVVPDYFADEEKERKICNFCGKRPGSLNKNDKAICPLCNDHLVIGENLVKKNGIAVFADYSSGILKEQIFGRYQLKFSGEDEFRKEAADGVLARLWRTEIGEKGQNRFSLKLINGYVPVYSKEDEYDDRLTQSQDKDERINISAPKTLNHIAEKALYSLENGKLAGVDALGVLKADVDNLGLIMACGIHEKYHSVSRAATLSRQMNNFFAVYLPSFLESSKNYMDVYTVFAGGDDLFLIGPWNKMADLAAELDRAFRKYVSNNSKIHFSAGISVHKPHTPVNKMAEAAEEALKESKKERARLTIFNETVKWSELDGLDATASKIKEWLDEKIMSSVMLYKLNKFIDMASMEERIMKSGLLHIDSMDCTKWRAMLAYSIERNIAKNKKADRTATVKDVHATLADWFGNFGGKMRIPLWTLQYNLRSKRR